MTDQEIIEYLADMADQLAQLSRECLPNAALALDLAAQIAREKLEPPQ